MIEASIIVHYQTNISTEESYHGNREHIRFNVSIRMYKGMVGHNTLERPCLVWCNVLRKLEIILEGLFDRAIFIGQVVGKQHIKCRVVWRCHHKMNLMNVSEIKLEKGVVGEV